LLICPSDYLTATILAGEIFTSQANNQCVRFRVIGRTSTVSANHFSKTPTCRYDDVRLCVSTSFDAAI
jgi:hypothetical protein